MILRSLVILLNSFYPKFVLFTFKQMTVPSLAEIVAERIRLGKSLECLDLLQVESLLRTLNKGSVRSAIFGYMKSTWSPCEISLITSALSMSEVIGH